MSRKSEINNLVRICFTRKGKAKQIYATEEDAINAKLTHPCKTIEHYPCVLHGVNTTVWHLGKK